MRGRSNSRIFMTPGASTPAALTLFIVLYSQRTLTAGILLLYLIIPEATSSFTKRSSTNWSQRAPLALGFNDVFSTASMAARDGRGTRSQDLSYESKASFRRAPSVILVYLDMTARASSRFFSV